MNRLYGSNKIWRVPFLAGFLLIAATAGLMADETNTISKPAGIFRLTIPAGRQMLVSMPLDAFNSGINAVLTNQLTGDTNELYADKIIKWDNSLGSYTNAYKADYTGDSEKDGRWFGDFTNWTSSDFTFEPGEGFWIRNDQPYTQTVFLCGSVVLDSSRTKTFQSGLTLFGYPFSSKISINGAAFTNGANASSDSEAADQIHAWDVLLESYLQYGLHSDDTTWRYLTNWSGSAVEDYLTPGKGYWYKRNISNSFDWIESRSYGDSFPANTNPPVITAMVINSNKDEVTLTINVTGVSGEKLEIYYKDVPEDSSFDSGAGWLVAATNVSSPSQTTITWTDAGSAQRDKINLVFSRMYLAARGDVDSDGDGIPDARETYVTGTSPTSADTDGDGLSDFAELYVYSTDPLLADTDHDGMSDAREIFFGKAPCSSNSYSSLPFSELFETGTVSAGDLNGQHGWEASPSGKFVVQTQTVYQGSQALQALSNETATAVAKHFYVSGGAQEAWQDFHIRAGLGLTPTNSITGSAAFFFNNFGRLVVYDGLQAGTNKWVTLTNHVPVAILQWVRISLKLDYSAQRWLICLDGAKLVEDLGFANSANEANAFWVHGGECGFLDNLSITLSMPSDLSLDGDSLPDAWEMVQFGNLAQTDSGDPDNDGLTNLQEYQCGANPNSADSDSDGYNDGYEVSQGADPANPLSVPVISVSGTISFAGSSESIIVMAVTNADSWQAIVSATTAPSGSYSITNVPQSKDYFIKSFRDSNTNGIIDSLEAYGAYTNNPVNSATNISSIDIVLFDPDTDSDGLPDWWELEKFGNLDQDPGGDADNDGLTNLQECQLGTNPTSADTDNDGMTDGAEFTSGSNPLQTDSFLKIDAASGTNTAFTGFEPSEGYTLGLLNLQNGWVSSNAVAITDTGKYAGLQSVRLTGTTNADTYYNAMAWDMTAQGRDHVWLTFFTKPAQGTTASQDVSSSVAFFFKNDCLYAYDGLLSTWKVSQSFTSDSNGWYRIDVNVDYSTRKYLVCVNGILALEDIGFVSTNRITLARIKVTGGDALQTAPDTFVDNFRISSEEPDSELDFDNDGLSNAQEYELGTDPKDSDTDNDGIPDKWEVDNGLNPLVNDANEDPDNDGLTNIQEYLLGTDLFDADTDDDGLSDGDEVITYLTNPLNPDGDGDGMFDGFEVTYGLNPFSAADASTDADNDGLTNLQEYQLGTNPNSSDTDGDGISDYIETEMIFSDPLVADFNGVVTTVATVSGSSTTNWLGTWTTEGSFIYARERSGYVDYTITAPSNGVFAIKVNATQHNPLTTQNTFDLSLYVDGALSGRQDLIASYGSSGSVVFFLPWISAGDHVVRIRWRNLEPNTFLQIDSLQLLEYGGNDANSNGVPDWLENRQANISALAAQPATSIVSPVCLEGESYYQDLLSVTADYIPEGQTQQVISVKHGLGENWYADVLLSPTNDTVIQVLDQGGAISYTSTVAWAELNILDGTYTNEIPIRSNSSLLLNAYPAGATNGTVTIEVYDSATNLITNIVTAIDQPAPHLFDQAGTFTVSGSYSNETLTTNGSITVKAVAASFAADEAVCVASESRTWDCPNVPATNDVTVEHDETLTVSSSALAGGGLRFTLLNNYDTPFYLVARLGEDGPILDNAKISTVYGDNGSYWRVVENYADGSRLVVVRLQLGYVPSDIQVKLHIFAGGVTFDDGTLDKTLTAADFNEIGVATYYIVQGAGVTTSICHTTKIYEGSTYIGGD